jgi:hypothetical protein
MRKVYYGLIIGFVLFTFMWTCMKGIVGSTCGNQIITEQLSPDKKFKFVVFVRDCGATTGFYTHVSILRGDKKLRDDDSGNVLTLDDHYFGDYVNKYGGADAKVEWIANRKILIHFDSKAQGAIKETKVKGIEITYEEIRGRPNSPQQQL